MRKLTIAAAITVFAASLASYIAPHWHFASSSAPLGSVSPHELTLAAPAMAVGVAPDAF